MHIRIIGITVLIIATSAMGYKLSRDYISRIIQLEKIRTMLMHLRGEINYSNNSVGEALEGVSFKLDGIIGRFLENVVIALKESQNPLDELWNSMVDEKLKKESNLKEQDLIELKDFGRNLGTSDRQTQINNINRYENILDITISELKDCKNEKCKLYQTFGIMAGLFIGIILI